MKPFEITLAFDETSDPNVLGETILRHLDPNSRFGYMSFDSPYLEERDFTKQNFPSLRVRTLLLGHAATTGEALDIQWFSYVGPWDVNFDVFVHWDGDGTIVIDFLTNEHYLVNCDCKKDYEWDWENVGNSWVTEELLSNKDYYDGV